jgi:hypothetical protein
MRYDSAKAVLTTFGTVLFIVNSVLYVALHDVAKWHGAVQAGLALLGASCLVVALLRKDSQ